MCGTPPTAVSSGTVFLLLRRDILGGNSEDAGWAEWSVPTLTDAHNPELWYETNPSLGVILSERTIRSELGKDTVDDNIQRLGLWLQYNQKSAISREEREQYAVDSMPELSPKKRLFFGVKYAKSTANVSLSVAVKTTDGKIFIEAVDCRPLRDGNEWIIAFLRSNSAEKVVIEANALFERKLFEGSICHKNQPSLAQAAANCEHRAIGSSGGFGYTSILEGADISLLESVSLAHWICANSKEKKKQIITY